MTMTDLAALNKIFKDEKLIQQALTHKSYVNEHPSVGESNERMEFLGDAILEFIVSKSLYKRFSDKEEGYLTALRANLVNTQNLASISTKMHLGDQLLLSKGEEDGGGRSNQSLLADTFEAIIGALFLDSGLKAVEKFVEDNILVDVDDKISKPLKDAKSRLQEKVQARSYPAPRYQVVSEDGPDHAKTFVVEVVINGKAEGKGEGKSKAEAEQSAASVALEKFL